MPQQIVPLADETVSDIAARVLGDASLFREILALNPEGRLTPFTALTPALAPGRLSAELTGQPSSGAGTGTIAASFASLSVPLQSELTERIEPVLSSVRDGVSSALQTTKSAIEKVKSYASILESVGLKDLSAEINGVFGPVDNALSSAQEAVDKYTNTESAIQLVDWLIGEN